MKAISHQTINRAWRSNQSLLELAQQHQYGYDEAGRLISHMHDDGQGSPVTTQWGYDANGNRTHENGQPIASYDAQDRLQTWRDRHYSYTEAGDLQTKTTPLGQTQYRYDALGSLRQVILPTGDQIDYDIDPLGRRIGKRTNGQVQWRLLYQDGLRPLAELDALGRIRSVFVYTDKAHSPSLMHRAGKTWRLISDHLGSIRLVIDAETGEIAQQIDYDTWGHITHDSNPGFQPFGFAGGLYDPDTGLTRFGARDYDAETGRWTAKDPILFNGGDTNLYGYVLQDPVNWIDRAGTSPEDVRKIQETFHRVVNEMNANGERLPTTGSLGGVLNNNVSRTNGYGLLRWITGYETLICGEQWDRIHSELMKLDLDDQWEFRDKHTFGHLFGEAVPSNPNDNIMHLDPWKNTITFHGPHIWSIR